MVAWAGYSHAQCVGWQQRWPLRTECPQLTLAGNGVTVPLLGADGSLWIYAKAINEATITTHQSGGPLHMTWSAAPPSSTHPHTQGTQILCKNHWTKEIVYGGGIQSVYTDH